jgi:AAA15 family ATPase/GTPase
MERGDIGFPEPLEQFLAMLSSIHLESDRSAKKSVNEFQRLADSVERYVQEDNKIAFQPSKLARQLKVSIRKGLTIDLYNASSSIKQLAPFLLYLRHRAQKNQLLLIDEPEMNLHPEAQSKLLEALAVAVNLGIKVFITTHSPYIMAHLNNLVSGDTNNRELRQQQASCLYLKDPRAFISSKKVSAYEMKDNKLMSLKDPDYGIRWDTLSDVSAELQQTYFEIQNKRKSTSDGQE